MGFCCFCWRGVLGPIYPLLSLPTDTVWCHFSEGLRLEVTGGYTHPRQSVPRGYTLSGNLGRGPKSPCSTHCCEIQEWAHQDW